MTRTNQLTKSILALLKVRGWFAYRQNTGAARYGNRMVFFGLPGAPDILAFKSGERNLGIEVKGTKRDCLSLKQKHWRWLWEQAGGTYIEAREIQDVLAVIGESQ